MTKRTFYAAQSPRGFANEIILHEFASRSERDAWVKAHADDGDVNSSSCGAYAISRRKAHQIYNARGDAATQSYNGLIQH